MYTGYANLVKQSTQQMGDRTMKERYTAQAHIKQVFRGKQWCPDLDEYEECHASTPAEAVKQAASKSSTGEAYRLVLEQFNSKFNRWEEVEFLNAEDYY